LELLFYCKSLIFLKIPAARISLFFALAAFNKKFYADFNSFFSARCSIWLIIKIAISFWRFSIIFLD